LGGKIGALTSRELGILAGGGRAGGGGSDAFDPLSSDERYLRHDRNGWIDEYVDRGRARRPAEMFVNDDLREEDVSMSQMNSPSRSRNARTIML
jgi:hypothetical protein